MAHQKSIFKIEGTLDGVTFYKSQDGYLIRTKGGVDGNRIKTDPRFARTRENGMEFKAAAQAGKLLRNTIRSLMQNGKDSRVTSRLTQVMSKVLKQDTSSFRGMRAPAVGVNTANGKALLKMFNFNDAAVMTSILFKPYTVDTTTGVIEITDLIPTSDILVPEGATHFSISGAMQVINFATKYFDLKRTNVENNVISPSPVNITLTPTALPTGTGIKLFYLKVEFFQEVNGNQYPLRNGAFNSLMIIEVV